MGVPNSEVGYTPAMSRREDHEVHKGHVVALEKKINVSKDMRDRGYFWKPKGLREQKSLGNAPLNQCFPIFRLSRNP